MEENKTQQILTCTHCCENFPFTPDLVVGGKGILDNLKTMFTVPKMNYTPVERWLDIECPHCTEEDKYKVIA
jgi:hypothetical protein